MMRIGPIVIGIKRIGSMLLIGSKWSMVVHENAVAVYTLVVEEEEEEEEEGEDI
jgi:hypothetical protein